MLFPSILEEDRFYYGLVFYSRLICHFSLMCLFIGQCIEYQPDEVPDWDLSQLLHLLPHFHWCLCYLEASRKAPHFSPFSVRGSFFMSCISGFTGMCWSIACRHDLESEKTVHWSSSIHSTALRKAVASAVKILTFGCIRLERFREGVYTHSIALPFLLSQSDTVYDK